MSGQCQIVPCGVSLSIQRKAEGDEMRQKRVMPQTKEGAGTRLRNLGFSLLVVMETEIVGRGVKNV